MKPPIKRICAGVFISVLFYFISALFGGFLYAIVCIMAGYEHMKDIDDIALLLSVGAVDLIIHFLFAFITVLILRRYAEKHNCISKQFFNASAISVALFAAIMIPILFSSKSGWLTYGVHSLYIWHAGKQIVKENDTNCLARDHIPEGHFPIDSQDGKSSTSISRQGNPQYCSYCGTKLTDSCYFCPNCGSLINKEQ